MKIFLFLFLILLSSCTTQSSIEKEIDKANYCEVKDDCTLIVSECPFECYISINKNEETRIMDLIDNYKSKSYASKCAYSCIQIEGFDCIENKCIILK